MLRFKLYRGFHTVSLLCSWAQGDLRTCFFLALPLSPSADRKVTQARLSQVSRAPTTDVLAVACVAFVDGSTGDNSVGAAGSEGVGVGAAGAVCTSLLRLA